ncbi:MAG: DedA family protein [Candidatus Liptonbacteria bacterium]|nr:DedA family protein [Candidatus Liptonbacteria bacterium]
MATSTLAAATQWAVSYGYPLMFLAMFVEGPAVTAIGAFAAALGYFDIRIVFFLSILGSLIPDVAYYALGFWGRKKLIDKYGRYFGITPERSAKVEKLINQNVGKALAFIKLFPLIATPGLIIAGASRVDLKKYVWWSLIITVPSSGFFLVLGYYFGAAYDKIVNYLNYGGYLAALALVMFVLISYVWKKLSAKFAEKLGE